MDEAEGAFLEGVSWGFEGGFWIKGLTRKDTCAFMVEVYDSVVDVCVVVIAQCSRSVPKPRQRC